MWPWSEEVRFLPNRLEDRKDLQGADGGGLRLAQHEALMKQNHWPIAKEGFPFLVGAIVLTILFEGIGWRFLALFGLLVTAFIAFFFRNPKRKVPALKRIVLSPADGRIVHVGRYDENRFLKETTLRVSIFMSLLDVHVNRAPVAGRIVEKSYRPGRFFVASGDKSSLQNEQSALILEMEDRSKILLIQIAGFLARRIVCYPNKGDSLRMGEIFGLIRFGSRVDLYLPAEVKPIVKVGQHVKGGETILGYKE
jgi:phosphatidylserine decarboxylase